MDRFIFIINSRSGRNKNQELYRRITAELKTFSIETKIHVTEHASDTEVIVKEGLLDGINHFIAVGGDGTVNTLASHLVHSDAALGIIPRGSGNGLARHFHMPRDIRGSLHQLVKKRIQRIDAIQINNQWSFNVAGIGFDGYISTIFGRDGKRGMRNYMKLINQEYKSYDPIDMEITSGTEQIKSSLFQLAIANASQYGNNAIIAPRADLSDQLLDITMIRKVPLALLPAFFIKVFTGNIQRSRYARLMTTSSMQILTSRPVHFHTDGDGRGISDQFRVQVIPSCLNLLH